MEPEKESTAPTNTEEIRRKQAVDEWMAEPPATTNKDDGEQNDSMGGVVYR